MQIRLLHNLARSGGTLISRCIGSMEGVIQLSEINPQGLHIFNPLVQAHKWYNLLTPQDMEHLTQDSVDFKTAIELLARRAADRGAALLIRDWSHLDFIGLPYIHKPSYRLTLSEVLKDRFDVIQTTTVRHPIDMWLSLRRLSTLKDVVSLEAYLRGYRRFADYCIDIGFTRYEDLVAEPDQHLALLCDRLNIRFDPGYRNRWYKNDRITGDSLLRNRGGDVIRPIPRRYCVPGIIDEFFANNDYRETIHLLGYNHPS